MTKTEVRKIRKQLRMAEQDLIDDFYDKEAKTIDRLSKEYECLCNGIPHMIPVENVNIYYEVMWDDDPCVVIKNACVRKSKTDTKSRFIEDCLSIVEDEPWRLDDIKEVQQSMKPVQERVNKLLREIKQLAKKYDMDEDELFDSL